MRNEIINIYFYLHLSSCSHGGLRINPQEQHPPSHLTQRYDFQIIGEGQNKESIGTVTGSDVT